MKVIKKLSGLSGCQVLLCEDNNSLFVRKISSSVEYNVRLRRQFIKQKFFKNPIIKTPIIYSAGKITDKFYFDMEFVRSETMSRKIGGSVSPEDLTKIITFFFGEIENYPIIKNKSSDQIILNKIKSIKPSKYVQNSLIFEKGIEKLIQNKWGNIPYSFCHGDMTLENILMGPSGEIYLIDFLDSFIDSWLIDVAKVLQDLELGWSWRNEPADSNRTLKCLIAKDFVINKLLSLKNGEELLHDCYSLFLLNILRIYPYLKDSKTEDFLNKKVIYLLNQFKGL